MYRSTNITLTGVLRLTSYPTKMTSWNHRIPRDMEVKFDVFLTHGCIEDGQPTVNPCYSTIFSIIRFYRNVYAHYHQLCGGCGNERIERELLEIFPDFIPKVFYELAFEVLYGKPSSVLR